MLKKAEKVYFMFLARERLLNISNEKCLLLNKPETYKRLKREHTSLEGLTFRISTNKYTDKDEKRAKKMMAIKKAD